MKTAARAKACTAMVVLACCGAIASAQSTPSRSSQQPTATTGTAAKEGADPGNQDELTVIGCLMRTDTSAWGPGTSGFTERGGPRPRFVLKDGRLQHRAERVGRERHG